MSLFRRNRVKIDVVFCDPETLRAYSVKVTECKRQYLVTVNPMSTDQYLDTLIQSQHETNDEP